MATLKQIAASRLNGARSNGPVTPEGKARVAQNGIKHGIYSDLVVLNNEDPDLYNHWRANHLAEWEPATDTEHNLVIDIVDARWRLRRLTVLETKAIDFEVDRMRPEVDDTFSEIDEGTRTVLGFNSLLTLNRTFEVIQTSIRTQHRIIERATSQLLKLGKVRRPLDGGPDHAHGLPCSTGTAATAESAEPSPEPAAHKSREQTRQMAPVSPVEAENHRTKPEPVASNAHSRMAIVSGRTIGARPCARFTRAAAA